MLQTLIGPIAELAGGWLNAKTQAQQANAKLKLTEAEARAKILVSKETSIQDWERIMAQGSQSSWKDEWLVVFFTILMACHFIPYTQDAMERGWQILEYADPMFWYIILTIVGASFGVTTMNKLKKK